MKYRFYTNSSKAWDAMLKAIKQATQSIYWEVYILADDTPGHNFFEVLEEKARQGVKIKIVVDALGSFWLSQAAADRLKKAGAEVLYFNHLVPWWNVRRFRYWWFGRNHKKILVVDEKIGFVGGVNVAKRFTHWTDLHVEVRGLIVRGLIRSFVKSYQRCGGQDASILQKRKMIKTKLRILDHWPRHRQYNLRKACLYHLQHASHKVVIATPYFIPHRWLINALEKARQRGVVIEMILPKISDGRVVTWANRIFASLVKKPGIDFYFTPAMIHAKAFLFDDHEGWVGSPNLDAQSFDYNAESVLAFQRKDMIRDLRRILDDWKQGAEKFYIKTEKKSWHQKCWEHIFKLLQPIL